MTINFDHIIEIDETEKRLTVFRLYKDGRKELYTYVDIPDIKFDKDKEKYKKFTQLLGENILIDSPVVRQLLGLSDES